MKTEKRLKGIVYRGKSASKALSKLIQDLEISNVFIITDENTLTH